MAHIVKHISQWDMNAPVVLLIGVHHEKKIDTTVTIEIKRLSELYKI